MKQQKRKTKVMFLIPFVVLALITLGISLLYDVIVNGTRETGEEETAEAETVELELTYAYQNSQWNAAIENMIHGFEEEHPEIDVQYEINYEDNVYEDLLSKRIARGELGDIVQLKTPETYAASGLLAAIPEEVAGAVSNVYAYRDQVCGVGAVESTWGILYNRSLFASYGLDEPETYEDFLEICGFLQRRDITPIGVGGADLWHMEFWVNHFFRTDVLAQDGDWLKKCAVGEVRWTDEAPARMMAHLGQLFENRYVNGDWITATDTSLSYKMAGEEIAMVYTGPWTAETVQKLNPDMELGWFYVPDENGTVRASDNLDTFWSITAACAEDPQVLDKIDQVMENVENIHYGNWKAVVMRTMIFTGDLGMKLSQYRLLDVDFYRMQDCLQKQVESQHTMSGLRRCIHEHYADLIQQVYAKGRSQDKVLIEDVKNYIREHYMEDLSIRELAEVACVSQNYFSAMFKKETGQNYKAYLTSIRMEEALRLLQETDLKTYEIGEKVGYNNVRRFVDAFKQIYAMSPMEYKKSMKRGGDST